MSPSATFTLGALLLTVGALLLVGGVGLLARRCGASPFAVGLAIVPLCASTPVLAVALTAALHDRHMLAVGVLAGSNIVNVGAVLGFAALLYPLTSSSRVVWSGIVVLLLATLLYWFVCRDHEVSRVDAGFLLVAFATGVAFLVRDSRQESAEVKAVFGHWNIRLLPAWVGSLAAVAGVAALVGGALLLVPAAAEIANKELNVTTRAFGVTRVAVWAALSVGIIVLVAARKGHADLALGTVLGATLCNMLLASGITAMIAPYGVTERAIMNDIPAMALFMFLLLAPLAHGVKVHRWEGAILLGAYIGFVIWQSR